MIRPKSLQPGDRLAVLGGSSPTSVSVEELTARLETAAATLKERRARLRELERRFLRKEDE